MKKMLFPLSLLSLAFCSPLAATGFKTSGQIWSETFTQLYQHDSDGDAVATKYRPAERWEVTRVDLDLSYELSELWSLHARVGFNNINNSQMRSDLPMKELPLSDQAFLRQYYARYQSPVFGVIDSGRISVPQISATSSTQSVFGIDPNLYHVIASSGDRPGVSIEKDFGACVLQAAVWQQTTVQPISGFAVISQEALSFEDFSSTTFMNEFLPSESYHQRALKLGVNGALHYYPVDTPSSAIAFNFGYQSRPISAPLVFGTLAQTGDQDNAIYTLTAFNALNESSINIVSYMGRLVFEAQAQYQVLGVAHQLFYGEDVTAEQQRYSDLFASDGYGVGYNATLGYHFQGGHYKLDRSSGQLMRQGHGWDIGISCGGVIQKNALALLSDLGQQDYLYTEVGTPGAGTYLTGEGRLAMSLGSENEPTVEQYTYIAVDATYPRVAYNEDNNAEGFNALELGRGGIITSKAYQIRTQSYTLHLNYAYNEHLAFQIELQSALHKNEIFADSTDSTGYINGPLSAKFQYLRTRLYVTF